MDNIMTTLPYKRIAIVGTTSSGKSTLAKHIADKFGHDFVDLDALHWEPNWTGAPQEVLNERVKKATQTEKWVVAGNYSSIQPLIWPHAEAIIWLDYSLPRIFWQLTRRTFSRWWNRELLWGTNYENLWNHLKLWSDESLFHWLFKTYWRRKREYPILLAMPEHRHLKSIHFKHPTETDKWLNNLIGAHHGY
jgi:adenylate kinase family enzyme